MTGTDGAGAGGGLRLEVDWSRCRGHGHCAVLLPEVVRSDAWGYPVLGDGAGRDSSGRGSATVPAGVEGAAERAASWCPNIALRLRRTS